MQKPAGLLLLGAPMLAITHHKSLAGPFQMPIPALHVWGVLAIAGAVIGLLWLRRSFALSD